MMLFLDVCDLGQVPYICQLQFPHLEEVKRGDVTHMPCGLPPVRGLGNSLCPSCGSWSALESKGSSELQGSRVFQTSGLRTGAGRRSSGAPPTRNSKTAIIFCSACCVPAPATESDPEQTNIC